VDAFIYASIAMMGNDKKRVLAIEIMKR